MILSVVIRYSENAATQSNTDLWDCLKLTKALYRNGDNQQKEEVACKEDRFTNHKYLKASSTLVKNEKSIFFLTWTKDPDIHFSGRHAHLANKGWQELSVTNC